MNQRILHESHARYDLDQSEIELLSKQLSERYSHFLQTVSNSGDRYGCISVDGNDPLANLGRALEQQVFDEEAGDHSVEMMHSEYSEYEDRSIFFLGIEVETGAVSGCLRSITGTAGYGPMVKSMRDCIAVASFQDLGIPGRNQEIDLRELSSIDPEVGYLGRHRNPPGNRLDRRFLETYHAMRPGDGILDMATTVVPRAVRTSDNVRLSLLLYACSWRAALALNMSHAVTFIRQNLLDDFRNQLGMIWEDLGGLGGTQYIDGDPFLSQPAYAHLDSFRHMFEQELIRSDLGVEPKIGPPFNRFVQLMANPKHENLFLLA